MNIAGKPHQVCIVLNNNAFKPAMKQMTRTKMSVVKSAGISQRQPLHAFGKIGLIRPQKYMYDSDCPLERMRKYRHHNCQPFRRSHPGTLGDLDHHEKCPFVHSYGITHDTARLRILFSMLCPWIQTMKKQNTSQSFIHCARCDTFSTFSY